MRRLIPLVLLAMLLSACKIRLDTILVINDDESGTIAIEISLDEELRQLADQGDGGGLDDLTVAEGAPEGWEVSEFVDGEFEGVRATADFDDLAGLEDRIREIASQTGAENDNLAPDFLSQLSIERTGDEFSFAADLTGLEEGLGAALEGGDDGGLGIDPSAFIADLFEIRLVVTMPGAIVSSNADATAESTLTWNIAVTDDGRVLLAESTLDEGSSTGLIIGLAVLAGAVALVVIGVMQRRGSREAGAEEPAVPAAD